MAKYFPLLTAYVNRRSGYDALLERLPRDLEMLIYEYALPKKKFDRCMHELNLYALVELLLPVYYCIRCKVKRAKDTPHFMAVRNEIDDALYFDYIGHKCLGCTCDKIYSTAHQD